MAKLRKYHARSNEGRCPRRRRRKSTGIECKFKRKRSALEPDRDARRRLSHIANNTKHMDLDPKFQTERAEKPEERPAKLAHRPRQ